MTPTFAHRGYQIYTAENSRTGPLKSLVDRILDNKIEAQHVFKDHQRTLSARIQLNDQSIMLKIPRARNRRNWERFLTLFRSGEGVRIHRNLTLLQELGLNAPYPLLAGEKRKFGFVVDSFACYAFEEGQPAGANDAEKVLLALLHLHQLGYIRTDPQSANFLLSDRGVVFIDFRLKKPMMFPALNKNLELAKFLRVYPEARNFLPTNKARSLSFRFAEWLEWRLFCIRRGKRGLKRSLNRQLKDK